MSSDSSAQVSSGSEPRPSSRRPRRAYAELFLISFVILFFELACIRWFGSTVVFLTFFTNLVLMACFLGMSVGCLTADSRKDYIEMALAILLVAAALAFSLLWGYYKFVELNIVVGQAR